MAMALHLRNRPEGVGDCEVAHDRHGGLDGHSLVVCGNWVPKELQVQFQ